MNMALHYINLPFKLMCLWNIFLLNITYLVLKVCYLLFDTMNYGHIIDWSVCTNGHWTWVAACFTGGLFSVYILPMCAFVDVCVFNPFAPSNVASSLLACYKRHENSWTKDSRNRACFIYSWSYVSHWWTGSCRWGNILMSCFLVVS